MDYSFDQYIMSSFISCNNFFCLKVYFSDITIAISAFLATICIEYLFPSFTFRLFVYLDLNLVFCKWIVEPCVIIHFANVCLLIREFKNHLSKVITKREGVKFCHFMNCFSYVLYLFSPLLSPLLLSVVNNFFLVYHFDSLSVIFLYMFFRLFS